MPHHDILISKLKGIKVKNKNHFRFLSLVEKKQYDKALLTGCAECKRNDEIQLELITTLLGYINELNIDVNQEDNLKSTALWYAMNLKNNKLYLRLKKVGADDTIQCSNSLSIRDNHDIKLYEEVQDLINPNFIDEETQLKSLYTKMSTRSDVKDDKENAKFDLVRMKFIIRTLTHLHKCYSGMNKGNLIPLTEKYLDAEQRRMLFNITNRDARTHLERVCFTIKNLSGELRDKYSKLFKPEPFTWHTFERLGGLIKLKEPTRHYYLPLTDDNVDNPGFGERFQKEFEASEEYCEEAIIDIVDIDVPLLQKFFEEVYDCELQPMGDEPAPVNPVQLVVCKAFLNRLGDNITFSNILNLLNYSEKELSRISPDELQPDNMLLVFRDSSPATAYKERFDLSRKSGQHAALRRLQHIGELCTGKKFSKRMTDLDDTTDWGALIAVRDTLCHPDERDNKYKIDLLLKDKDTLEQIVGNEIGEFLCKFFSLISFREKATGVFNGDTKEHWKNILKEYIQWLNKIPEISEEDKIVRGTSLENEERFIAGLQKGTPEEVITECRSILNGTVSSWPDKKRIGFLLSHLQPRVGLPDDPSRKQYKLLSNIMQDAIKQKSTEKERQLKREQSEANKQQRMKDREAKLTGLISLRQLAKTFAAPPAQKHLLNPVKRVCAALEALNNIKEFLTDSGYLIPDLPYTTIEEWDTYHIKKGREVLALQLEINCELNDAIEFNAGHLLQHLDKIREYNAAQNSFYLTKGYDALRTLRNYIEHGDPLFDTIGYAPSMRNYPTQLRQQKILPVLIDLIYNFVPELELIKEILINEKSEKSEKNLKQEDDGSDLSELELATEAVPSLKVTGNYEPGFFGKKPNPKENVVLTPRGQQSMEL